MAEDQPCAACGMLNPSDARFCASCGASLAAACPQCGAPLVEGARFCAVCGASVEARQPTEERKVVSVLFADLVGFTTRSDRADPEDVQAALRPYYPRVKQEIERLGGVVEKFIGDAVVGVFGAPLAHEDDAERAVRAGLAITAAIVELNDQHAGLDLAVRVAVNTGEAMVSLDARPEMGEGFVAGDVVNTASRLQSVAPAGRVAVGELTYLATRQVIDYEELDPVSVKGKAQPVAVWLATTARGEPDREQEMTLTPLVGRQHELQLLRRLWDQVVEDRRPYLVTILGPPGIGKSRLVREASASMGERGRVLRGRCRAYGETTGYGAFGQQVQQAGGILETDPVAAARQKLHDRALELDLGDEAKEVADHLAVLLGLPSDVAPDKTVLFYSARRFAEALAREQPTALVVEDIHWAGAPLLDLLESLAARCRDIPLVLITTARPELLDVRPTWGGGLSSYTAIPLDPLTKANARDLAMQLFARGTGSHDALDGLIETSGGNPLFIEELASSLAERPAGVVAGLPATVQAIIAARLDRLPVDERRVLQDASVIGATFWRGVLASLGHDEAKLDELLDRLELRDFVRRQTTSRVAGDREFVFKHILIREVAYGTLPRAERRKRHADAADYIERATGDRVRESASILAHHWRESGELAKALPYLLTAAEVASKAWAKQEALDLYTQGLELAEQIGEAGRVRQALLDRARVRIEAGDHAGATEDLERLLGGELPDEQRVVALFLRSRAAYWLADAPGVQTYAQQAATAAQRLGNADIEARALAVLAELASMEGDLDRANELMSRSVQGWRPDSSDPDLAYSLGLGAIFHYWQGDYQAALDMAQRGFDLGMEVSNVAAVLQAASNVGMSLIGLSRTEEGLDRFERAVQLGRELEPALRLTGRVLNMRAGALREVGDLDAARELSAEALEMGRNANFPGAIVSAKIDLLFSDLAEGRVGRAETAVPELLEHVEATKGWHQWLWGGRLAAAQTEIALASGRVDEAVELAAEALEKAARQRRLKYLCRSRTLLGEALFSLGRFDQAGDAFREAVSEAERLGHAPSLWPALGGLSRTFDRLGREQEAAEALARARKTLEDFGAGLTHERRARLVTSPSAVSLALVAPAS
jgi:class 3 adenylate cyclase/tetratricopeptide (TPR) repeat protein